MVGCLALEEKLHAKKSLIVGLFAARDLLVKGRWDGTKLDRPVREFMTPDPVTLTPHDTIAFALNRAVIAF